MKREQLEGKFIICRTQDEADFIAYWAEELFGYPLRLKTAVRHVYDRGAICVRLKSIRDYGAFGCDQVGYYANRTHIFGYIKEEECSVLFGNLVKRWKHEHRTENSDSMS